MHSFLPLLISLIFFWHSLHHSMGRLRSSELLRLALTKTRRMTRVLYLWRPTSFHVMSHYHYPPSLWHLNLFCFLCVVFWYHRKSKQPSITPVIKATQMSTSSFWLDRDAFIQYGLLCRCTLVDSLLFLWASQRPMQFLLSRYWLIAVDSWFKTIHAYLWFLFQLLPLSPL